MSGIKLEEWNDARTAALFLKPCTPKYLTEEIGVSLERRSSNRHSASSARGGGYLYHRHDLERVRAIMDALGCSASKAVWLLLGIRRLGERAMLPHLSQTLEDSTKAASVTEYALPPPRRRFR